jgi:hypothetical protein
MFLKTLPNNVLKCSPINCLGFAKIFFKIRTEGWGCSLLVDLPTLCKALCSIPSTLGPPKNNQK